MTWRTGNRSLKQTRISRVCAMFAVAMPMTALHATRMAGTKSPESPPST
jgi:hypothetical protein